MNKPDQMLKTALAITESAAEISLSHFRKNPDVNVKSDLSPVTVADIQTEEAIRAGLLRHFPDVPIFGEEFGKSGSGDEMWIVDPIDGTRSFIAGVPLFGLLLGYIKRGKPELGIIRMPALGEVYTGGVKFAAALNGEPIIASNCTSLEQARLFINEGDKIATSEPEVFDRLVRSGNLRRMGADCYPHALVAAGFIDAVVDFDLQPYDYLPVSAVVSAAGGVMTDWQGKNLSLHSDGRTITAATPELHRELVDLINVGNRA